MKAKLTSDKPYKEGFLHIRIAMSDEDKKRISEVLDSSGMTTQALAYSALMNECEKYETAVKEGKLYRPTMPNK